MSTTMRRTGTWERAGRFAVLVGSALLAFAPLAEAAERIVTIESRPGITVDVAVLAPDGEPVAVAVLFAGGEGNLGLWRGSLGGGRNFLIRSRKLFAAHGMLVLSVDAPSDRRAGGVMNIRDTAAHRTDIAAVVAWVRRQTAAPVWLLGNSTGTISVAYLAAALEVDGAVLTSSFTEPSRLNRATVLDAPLDRVRTPALIVHHRGDGCDHTPLHATERIKSRLRAAPKVEIMLFDGGDPPRSGPCDALAQHGFLGIEKQVVDAIAGWIKAQAKR